MKPFINPLARPHWLAAMLLCAATLSLSACAASRTPPEGGRLRVVAAESPWGAVARAVGGPEASVVSVVADPTLLKSMATMAAACCT